MVNQKIRNKNQFKYFLTDIIDLSNVSVVRPLWKVTERF